MAFYLPITDTTGTAVTMSPAAIAGSRGSGPSVTGYGLYAYSQSPLSCGITRIPQCNVGTEIPVGQGTELHGAFPVHGGSLKCQLLPQNCEVSTAPSRAVQRGLEG